VKTISILALCIALAWVWFAFRPKPQKNEATYTYSYENPGGQGSLTVFNEPPMRISEVTYAGRSVPFEQIWDKEQGKWIVVVKMGCAVFTREPK
jgi:hypothetical protein